MMYAPSSGASFSNRERRAWGSEDSGAAFFSGYLVVFVASALSQDFTNVQVAAGALPQALL
jgi:hypothetical protein